jgi:hypothetical protein
MVLAYRGVAVESLPQTQVIEDRQKHLFDTYICRMLKHRGMLLKYSPESFLNWLIWLAQQMVQESQTVFLIEQMQPFWLQSGSKKQYRILVVLSAGLSAGLFFGLFFGLFGLFFGLNAGRVFGSAGLFFGLFFGLFGLLIGLEDEINVLDKLQWSWQRVKSKWIMGLGVSLIVCLLAGLKVWTGGGSVSDLIRSLTLGLILGLSLGLPLMVSLGGRPIGIKSSTTPNQGIWNSAKNFSIRVIFGLMYGLTIGLFAGLFAGLRAGLTIGLRAGLTIGLTIGLAIGLIAGLVGGGDTCIQHFSLRLILTRQGHIPWNYARFLDHAAERLFLQKVGGGYIFIHRLLLEHIAQLDPHTFTTENRSR